MTVEEGDWDAQITRYVSFDDNMEVVLKLVNEIHSKTYNIPDFTLVSLYHIQCRYVVYNP